MKLMTLETHPSYGGGSEAMSLAISRGLAARGHQILLAYEREGSMLQAYERIAAQVIKLPLPRFSLRSPLSTAKCVKRIGTLVRDEHVDLVFSSHLGYLEIAALVRMVYGVPFCFHLGLPAANLRRFSNLTLRSIDAGIAPSLHTLESWRREGWPIGRLSVIPNWVDTEKFKPTAVPEMLRQDLGIPVNCLCIAFVGRVCAEKGVETLLRAFPLLHSNVSGIKLIIVGPCEVEYQPRFKSLLAEMDEAVRRDIIVRPVSSVPEGYIACSDIVCVPSLWEEPFGLSLVEAMACATPVVATTVGMFSEILGDYCADMLVPRDDHVGLASRLTWWLTQPVARRERGLQLRARVMERFEATKGLDAYESIFKNIIFNVGIGPKCRRFPLNRSGRKVERE